MRIITGRYKRRYIKMPAGIRPTQNKVRKALFDILGDIQGLSFLELFAGSGAIGFEALSRGVRDLTFVEADRDCQIAIKKNIDFLEAACSLCPKEAVGAIKMFSKNRRKFDIIFLDPPYYKVAAPRLRSGSTFTPEVESLTKKTLQTLDSYDILVPNGFIVIQHFKKDSLPDKLGVLNLFRQSRYGDTLLSFYKKGS